MSFGSEHHEGRTIGTLNFQDDGRKCTISQSLRGEEYLYHLTGASLVVGLGLVPSRGSPQLYRRNVGYRSNTLDRETRCWQVHAFRTVSNQSTWKVTRSISTSLFDNTETCHRRSYGKPFQKTDGVQNISQLRLQNQRFQKKKPTCSSHNSVGRGILSQRFFFGSKFLFFFFFSSLFCFCVLFFGLRLIEDTPIARIPLPCSLSAYMACVVRLFVCLGFTKSGCQLVSHVRRCIGALSIEHYTHFANEAEFFFSKY